MKDKLMKEIKEKHLILTILLFLIFLTSSFDVILNFELVGFTFRANQILCLPLFLYYLYLVIKKRKIEWVLGSKSLIIWTIITLLFTFNTILPSMNIGYHLWLIFNIVLIFSIVGIVNDKEFSKRVLKLYVISFTIMAVWGMLEFLIGCLGFTPEFIKQWWIPGLFPRVNGFTFEPSYYATYMLIGWTMVRVLAMNNEYTKKEKIFLWSSVAVDTIAIILSSSRIGIGFMAMFEGFNWLRKFWEFIKTKDKKILNFLIKDALTVIAICICYVGMVVGIGKIEQNISKKEDGKKPEQGQNQMMGMLLNGTGIGNTSSHSVSEREEHFVNVLKVFAQSPIFGKGLGGIYAQMTINKGLNVFEVSPQDVTPGICIFAEVLAGSGIIGFIFFATYIIVLIVEPLKLSKKANKTQKNVIFALVLALIMELGILQLNQNILRPYLWIHIAMISMYYNIIKNEYKNMPIDKKTKVAVDARMLKMSGIGTYIKNLMKNDCYDIALGNKEDILETGKIKEENIIEFNQKIYGIKEQLKFPYKKLRKLNPDILHVPHYNVPIFYGGKMVVTIHDLTHLKCKEFLPNKFAYYYAKIMLWIAIKKASKIIVVSENTKKDILEYYKVAPEKIEVIYNGVSKEFYKKEKNEIEYLYDKYSIPKNSKKIMYVGNLKPHKNLERLLEAFSKIKDKSNLSLILVGKAFENYNVLGKKEEELGIKDKVIHTGEIQPSEIVNFYNLADVFVFPSIYEGFGLPIIESLACGTKVACSKSSSMPEVGGTLVEYFDPYNIDEMKEKIEKSLENQDLDMEKVETWLKNFDWSESANKTKTALKKNNIKKIGIDGRPLTEKRAGIGNYTYEIIKKLNEIDTENEYYIYSNKDIVLDFKLNNNFHKCTDKSKIGTLWLYFLLPSLLKRDDIDIFWGTQHCLPKRNKFTENLKYVLTIHDLAIFKFKKIGSLYNTIIQKLIVKRACDDANEIIAISNATKKDIIEICEIPEEKIKVVYNGTNYNEQCNVTKDKEIEVLKKLKLENKKYILFLGTIEPRKNVDTLIKAFEILKEKEKELILVIAGGLGWRYQNTLNLIENSKVKNDIYLIGYVDKETKNILYKNAKCFVYPSLYEGFGLPILEAMNGRTIVVTEKNSSLTEVGGDSALYCDDELDANKLCKVIEKAISINGEERKKIIENGIEIVKRFSWKDTATGILNILKN